MNPRDNCVCRIVPIGRGVTIEFCPMHAAAPGMLAMLKCVEVFADDIILSDQKAHMAFMGIIRGIRNTIAEVEGGTVAAVEQSSPDQAAHPSEAEINARDWQLFHHRFNLGYHPASLDRPCPACGLPDRDPIHKHPTTGATL